MNQYPINEPMASYQTNGSNGFSAATQNFQGRSMGANMQNSTPMKGYFGETMDIQPNVPMPRKETTLQMQPSVSQDVVEAPMNMQEAYAGSLKALLGQNLGHYVVAIFLIGTQSPVSWEGFLHAVGNDYLVIFQPDMNRYITCDLYSLKFVEFHDEKGVVPPCLGYQRRDGVPIW